MKLYEAPRNSKVMLIDDTVHGPPAGINPIVGDVYEFKHVDGMYSLCFDSNGDAVHIPAWAEVRIVK